MGIGREKEISLQLKLSPSRSASVIVRLLSASTTAVYVDSVRIRELFIVS